VKHTVHRVVFGLLTAFGGFLGILVGLLCSQYFVGLSPVTIYASYAAFLVFGLVLGVLFATPASGTATMFLDALLHKLQKMALAEVVLSGMGLVAGLSLAFFVSLALQSLNFTAVPVIGTWLGPVLILVNALLFGSLGAFLGYRLGSMRSAREFFSKNELASSAQRILVDTSIIVDGRLGGLLATGFLPGVLVVPQFVLGELQFLADAEDPLKRARGRRGLESLEELKTSFPFEVLDDPAGKGVDQKLIYMARSLGAAILTNDYNLQKVASVQGIKVLNLNQLASALKPSAMPGQMLHLLLEKEGKESHQGVAHFEDGTMIVVERGRPYIGKEIICEVASVMQTATGKIVFAKFRNLAVAEAETPEIMEESA